MALASVSVASVGHARGGGTVGSDAPLKNSIKVTERKGGAQLPYPNSVTEIIGLLASSAAHAGSQFDQNAWSYRKAKLHVDIGRGSASSIYKNSCLSKKSESFCKNSLSRAVQFYQNSVEFSNSSRQLFDQAIEELSTYLDIQL